MAKSTGRSTPQSFPTGVVRKPSGKMVICLLISSQFPFTLCLLKYGATGLRQPQPSQAMKTGKLFQDKITRYARHLYCKIIL